MIGFRVTNIEFDEELLADKIGDAETRGMSIIGFQTRQEARQLIQPGAGPSPIGTPPHDQTGTLKRFIRYSVDGKVMTAGPQLLTRKSRDAVAALEKGGVSMNARHRMQTVRRRPFMAPAFEMVRKEQIPQVWQDSIR